MGFSYSFNILPLKGKGDAFLYVMLIPCTVVKSSGMNRHALFALPPEFCCSFQHISPVYVSY